MRTVELKLPPRMNSERTRDSYLIKDDHIQNIKLYDKEVLSHFTDKIETDRRLSRKLVSFQANKKCPYFRWYKYKEAFSAELVKYFLTKFDVVKGKILDPFAGMGTALFAAAELGYKADGIELLPVGQQIIKARKIASSACKKNDIILTLTKWRDKKPWEKVRNYASLNTLRITKGAYPTETEEKICKYIATIAREEKDASSLLLFALLCVLESISYTRKDGQYLRWDHRSGRCNGRNNFNKGRILPFEEAIAGKLNEIILDSTTKELTLFDFFESKSKKHGSVNLLCGSCLDILPKLKTSGYAVIFTSPPYCNRYDYTRTYALEHAVLGLSEEGTANLRQQMISCTVENKEKELLKINENWGLTINICDTTKLLQEIINHLELMKSQKELNNNGIPRMVKGYFYEMACVIQECYRVLKKDGLMFMVNDNVRYAGVSISVDLILSFIAENLGFIVENIFVLPNGKGNSSQQMGIYGKESLRKCVYVWRKAK